MVNRSGERKSSSAHYCEKGAVKVSPPFILTPLPTFFWPREWKLKSNSQNEWWNCTVCTEQSQRLWRAVKRGPSEGRRQRSALGFFAVTTAEAGAQTAVVGRQSPSFCSWNTVCKSPVCIKSTATPGCSSLAKGNRNSSMTSVTKIWAITSQASEQARAWARYKDLIVAAGMANFD